MKWCAKHSKLFGNFWYIFLQNQNNPIQQFFILLLGNFKICLQKPPANSLEFVLNKKQRWCGPWQRGSSNLNIKVNMPTSKKDTPNAHIPPWRHQATDDKNEELIHYHCQSSVTFTVAVTTAGYMYNTIQLHGNSDQQQNSVSSQKCRILLRYAVQMTPSSAAHNVGIKGYRPPLAVLHRQQLHIEHFELLRTEERRRPNLEQMQWRCQKQCAMVIDDRLTVNMVRLALLVLLEIIFNTLQVSKKI